MWPPNRKERLSGTTEREEEQVGNEYMSQNKKECDQRFTTSEELQGSEGGFVGCSLTHVALTRRAGDIV